MNVGCFILVFLSNSMLNCSGPQLMLTLRFLPHFSPQVPRHNIVFWAMWAPSSLSLWYFLIFLMESAHSSLTQLPHTTCATHKYAHYSDPIDARVCVTRTNVLIYHFCSWSAFVCFLQTRAHVHSSLAARFSVTHKRAPTVVQSSQHLCPPSSPFVSLVHPFSSLLSYLECFLFLSCSIGRCQMECVFFFLA